MDRVGDKKLHQLAPLRREMAAQKVMAGRRQHQRRRQRGRQMHRSEQADEGSRRGKRGRSRSYQPSIDRAEEAKGAGEERYGAESTMAHTAN